MSDFDDDYDPDDVAGISEANDDVVCLITLQEGRAFHRHVKALNKLIRQVRERVPEAQYYLACSMGARLHLMSGDSHTGPKGTARQDRIIETATLDFADGGDW